MDFHGRSIEVHVKRLKQVLDHDFILNHVWSSRLDILFYGMISHINMVLNDVLRVRFCSKPTSSTNESARRRTQFLLPWFHPLGQLKGSLGRRATVNRGKHGLTRHGKHTRNDGKSSFIAG